MNIKTSTLKNGKHYLVSTVALQPEGSGYETMVFRASDDTKKVSSFMDLDCKRYDSHSEAQVGHDVMVSAWSDDSDRF
jgi:hypothetical protein